MKTTSLTATRYFNIFATGQTLKSHGRFRLTGPHFKFLVLLLVACGASNLPILGSDLIGIYAFVDKVVMEPNELVALWAANQPPALSISPPLDGVVVISWPVVATGFILETTDNLAAPAWMVVTNPIVTREDRNTVAITAANETKYYRLKK